MFAMTRKRFLRLTTIALPATAFLGLSGCGDDDDDGVSGTTTGPGATGTTGGPTTTSMTTADGGTTTGEATTTGPGESTSTGADTTGADTTGATGTTTGGTGMDTTAGLTCDAVEAEVGGPTMGPPHTHMLEVPAEDVAAGAEATYETSTDAQHFHEVTVTAEMFEMLAAGETVMVDTLADATGHMHPITLMCA